MTHYLTSFPGSAMDVPAAKIARACRCDQELRELF